MTDPTNELLPLLYDKLKELAGHYLRHERGYQTLQPTALVNEAYLRMRDIKHIDWQGQQHFFAMAATQMRRVLVERARAAGAKKRGERPQRVTLDEGLAIDQDRVLDVLALDQAMTRLATHSERQSQVVELRLFAGMSVVETAGILGVSERTVKNDWQVARAWLARELRAAAPGEGEERL